MATSDNLKSFQRGNTSGAIYPYPQPWPGQPWQQPRVYPTINTWVTSPREEDYANEIEVERGEHDAVLRFYRTRDKSKRLVKEITIPVGLLDWLTSEG